MDKYSKEDRIFLYEAYIQSGKCVTSTLRKWSSAFKNKPKPSRSTVERLVERFKETGSVMDNKDALRTAKRHVRTPDMIETVRGRICADPKKSVNDLARDLNISASSAYRILHDDLNLHPYKVQTLQRIDPSSVEKRFDFAAEICELIDRDELDPRKIIFTDEAHFWLDGYVNNQNYRIWGSEKPAPETKPLYPEKVTVWAGICAEGIVGPIFTRDKETVDKHVYRRILELVLPQVKANGWAGPGWHWQQDGAPPHCSKANLDFIETFFKANVISGKFPQRFDKGMEWPPYSPVLSPMDFFLWGYTKDKVYRNKPKTVGELKKRIEEVMRSVTLETCCRAMANFEKRLRMVVSKEGRHIEDVLD